MLFLSPVVLVPVAVSAHPTAASACSHMITRSNPVQRNHLTLAVAPQVIFKAWAVMKAGDPTSSLLTPRCLSCSTWVTSGKEGPSTTSPPIIKGQLVAGVAI